MYKKITTSMVALILALALSLSMMSSATLADFTPTTDEDYYKFMSFNLRYDTTSHGAMAEQVRGPQLLSLVQGYGVDSIGFQEATDTWMKYLRTEMAALGYSYVGVGRDTGTDDAARTGTGNEFSPIFYKSDKYELVESGTFWLSPTPDVKSGISWGAACTRICTYAVLKNKETNKLYAHFNTHTDHQSELARTNGAKIIVSRIEEISKKYNNIPVVSTGDFNSVRTDVAHDIMSSVMDDSALIAKKTIVGGPSFNEYQNPDNWTPGNNDDVNSTPNVDYTTSPIDYIFLSKGMFEVGAYTVVNDTFTFDFGGKTYTNRPCSDHFGVYCEAKIVNADANVFDDSAMQAYKANEYADGILPDSRVTDILAKIDNLSRTAGFSSTLDCSTSNPVSNLSNGTGSVSLDSGKYSGKVFWEITANLAATSKISAITIDAGANKDTAPDWIQVLGSTNGTVWKQIGSALTGDLSDGKIYIVLNKLAEAKYIKLVMPNVKNNAAIQSLSIYGFQSEANEKIDNATKVTPISGPSRSGGNENFEKAFDSNTGTKFYSKLEYDNINRTDPIIWKVTEGAVTATAYSLTTGSDTSNYPYRNPYNWILSGSLGGSDWTVIDEKSNYTTMTTANAAETVFNITEPESYQYYKLEIDYAKQTPESSQHRVQLSEISLYQSNGVTPKPDSELYAIHYVNYIGEPIRVDYGTPSDSLNLGTKSYVLFECGVETQCAIEWNFDAYDREKAGEQTISGTVILDDSGMTNPKNLTVSATVTVEDQPIPEPEYILGDIDGDKSVDVSDVVRLRALIMSGSHTDRELLAGDFDEDKILTVTDVVALRGYIMKGASA